jgi:predicted AAA+ superfamily ATPase
LIFSLDGLSLNLRNEINTNCQYYFYDNGIRNAVIVKFNALADRNDMGALWESFLVSESNKRNAHLNA